MLSQLIPDGQISFEGGQDASLPATKIAANKFAAGVNLSTTEGRIGPRWGVERKTIKFPKGGYSYKFNKIANFKDLFYSGKFQAQFPYQVGKKFYQGIVISGIIFLVDQKTLEAKVLTLNQDTQLNETTPRVNRSTCGKYIAISDFPSKPVIIEGLQARRSDRDLSELPAFNVAAYNQSRTFFSNFGNEFGASDALGNRVAPGAPITILETELEGSPYFGDIYRMPSKFDAAITAMASLQQVDESTGIGALIVASASEIYAYKTDTGRDTWLAGKFGTSVSDNAGIAGPRAVTNVNSDLFFSSDDAQLRSLSSARDEQKKWARTPLSFPVQNWISNISPELNKFASICYFKNKIFWTVRPYRTMAHKLNGDRILDVAHGGLLVLDTANIGADSTPVWDGLWTGVRPMDMCVNNERMFVMSKDSGSNQLYEMLPDSTIDRTDTGQRRRITTVLYTRDHYFQDLFRLKDLNRIDFNISEVIGEFSIDVKYKAADSSNFVRWGEFTHEVPYAYTDIEEGVIKERTSISFPELTLNAPSNPGFNPLTGDAFTTTKRVQFRVELKADAWSLNEYQVLANVNDARNNKEQTVELPIKEDFKVLIDDWNYREFSL